MILTDNSSACIDIQDRIKLTRTLHNTCNCTFQYMYLSADLCILYYYTCIYRTACGELSQVAINCASRMKVNLY